MSTAAVCRVQKHYESANNFLCDAKPYTNKHDICSLLCISSCSYYELCNKDAACGQAERKICLFCDDTLRMRAYFVPAELEETNKAVVVYIVGYVIMVNSDKTREAVAYVTLHNETTCFVADDEHIVFDLAGRTVETAFSPGKVSIHANKDQSEKLVSLLVNSVSKCMHEFKTEFEANLINMMSTKISEIERKVTCLQYKPIKKSDRRKRLPVHTAETVKAITPDLPVNRLPPRNLDRVEPTGRPKASTPANLGKGIRGYDLRQFMSTTSVRKDAR
eukprot:gene13069-15437_t